VNGTAADRLLTVSGQIASSTAAVDVAAMCIADIPGNEFHDTGNAATTNAHNPDEASTLRDTRRTPRSPSPVNSRHSPLHTNPAVMIPVTGRSAAITLIVCLSGLYPLCAPSSTWAASAAAASPIGARIADATAQSRTDSPADSCCNCRAPPVDPSSPHPEPAMLMTPPRDPSTAAVERAADGSPHPQVYRATRGVHSPDT